MKLPDQGITRQELISHMQALRAYDADWQNGNTFSLVYYAGEEVIQVAKEAYTMFFSENGLNPMAFPSLKKFESEVIAMTARMLGGDDDTVGNMTSGGTDSILMAVKTARDMARAEHPEITVPEMVIPSSVHAAFLKAASYFDVKPIRVPVASDFRADVAAMAKAVNKNTILLVGSAPCYPYGVVDPIEELSALALKHNINFHVDACLGGFLLPFLRQLGLPIPRFDFSLPGVTSMSADIHKYGYAAKGASTVLYRNKSIRQYQYTIVSDWSGGIYASPSAAGTRPGGAIAAAWAVMNFLGAEGYRKLASQIKETTQALKEGIKTIPGLYVLGEPDMSVFAFGSDSLDVYALGDEMDVRGWYLDRQQLPPSLHLMITPAHAGIVDRFLTDLAEAVNGLRQGQPQATNGSAALYGMLAQSPDPVITKEFIRGLMDGLTQI